MSNPCCAVRRQRRTTGSATARDVTMRTNQVYGVTPVGVVLGDDRPNCIKSIPTSRSLSNLTAMTGGSERDTDVRKAMTSQRARLSTYIRAKLTAWCL